MYRFIKRFTVIGRGTGDEVFQAANVLIPQSPISGAVAVRRLRAVFQPPQVYVQNNATTQGLGGIVHGTTVFQPLINR